MDVQRLKDIREELKGIDGACHDRYNGFVKRYHQSGPIEAGKVVYVNFNEDIYHEFLHGVCDIIGQNLKKIKDLEEEVRKGKEVALSRNDKEMLKEAEGRLSYCRRLQNSWSKWMDETFEIFEEEREKIGFEMKVQVRMGPDDEDEFYCF